MRNVPVVLRLAWESGPGVVTAGVTCRIAGALLPVMMLAVAKLILDAVQLRSTTGELRPDFWWLVALECVLAVVRRRARPYRRILRFAACRIASPATSACGSWRTRRGST